MDNPQSLLGQAFDFIHRSFLTVDTQVGLLIIALIAAFIMKSWKQIWWLSLLAVIVYTVVDVVWPLMNNGTFRLPDFFQWAFWQIELMRYIGFIIVITVFYVLKTLLVKTAAKA
jgi:hypothetical protein